MFDSITSKSKRKRGKGESEAQTDLYIFRTKDSGYKEFERYYPKLSS